MPSISPSQIATQIIRYSFLSPLVSANIRLPPTLLNPYTIGIATLVPFLVIVTPCADWSAGTLPGVGTSNAPIGLKTNPTMSPTKLTIPLTTSTMPLITFLIPFTTPPISIPLFCEQTNYHNAHLFCVQNNYLLFLFDL